MKIEANGILMEYELSGSGRCITLIHGAGDNLHAWYNQVPAFSPHYRVLAYDVRGHGQTELPEGELTTEIWVEDLHGLLKALDISETILLGYSMGGMIALAFTSAYPKIVKALILSNSGGMPPVKEEEMGQMDAERQARMEAIREAGMEAMIEDKLETMFSPGFGERHPEAIEKYRSILLQNNPEGHQRVMGRMGSPPVTPDLSQITCPTLIITGEYDLMGGAAAGKATQQAIRGSQLKVFPTGHASALEVPQEYNETVLKFLAEAGLG